MGEMIREKKDKEEAWKGREETTREEEAEQEGRRGTLESRSVEKKQREMN